jgi:3-oxoacyl-[acyl-carrier-protein] synthase-3
MLTSNIVSIAHALPATVLSYEEVEARFGVKEVASIAKMSGIRNRRVVAPGQCASDLAFAAAKRLLEHSRTDPSSIDLLLFASQTPDYRTPATAAVLHGRLGLAEACCTFDVNQACTSYLHALAIGHSMVAAGTSKRALVLNGDAITTLINPKDRGLVTLHGDAGAATLLESCDAERGGIEYFRFGTDGTNFARLLVPAGGARMPSNADTGVEITDDTNCVRSLDQLYMDGPAVFHFCVYKVTAFLKKLLEDRGETVADYDTVLLHQANKTMIDLVYRAIGAPAEKRFFCVQDLGNSSGASLPTVLAQAWREGLVKPSTRTLLCAFGGGLSWGAASIRWPSDAAAAVPGGVDVPAPVVAGAS